MGKHRHLEFEVGAIDLRAAVAKGRKGGLPVKGVGGLGLVEGGQHEAVVPHGHVDGPPRHALVIVVDAGVVVDGAGALVVVQVSLGGCPWGQGG